MARMSTRNGDLPPFDPAAFPSTPAEKKRMQEQPSGIFKEIGTLSADVRYLATGIAEVKADFTLMRAEVAALRRKMEEDRTADAPALGWANGQRRITFWGVITIAGAMVAWLVTQSLGWLRALLVH